jgi:hypothetical protein
MAIPPRKNKDQNKRSPKVIRINKIPDPTPNSKLCNGMQEGYQLKKLIEIKHIIKEKDVDVLIVNEANIVAEKNEVL